ncbi:MAG: hypothetical protein SVY53_14495 [Chloroflexota bacterium]|nr:hypothetical protein [Chloroflexota bacterium]
MREPSGEVFDLGYQHYNGPREGRARARKALWMNGVRTALGLGRGSRAKILPVMLFIFAMAPAVIMTLIVSVAGSGETLPTHADYYRVISIVLLLFSAIIAPELLCSDKREGVLFLYLVRPLTITDYLAARVLAFFSITFAFICTGQVILFIGFTLAASEPLNYLRDSWLDIPRFLAAGVVIALFTSLLPLAVSSFTTRRAYATAFVIGVFFISAPLVTGILTESGTNTAPPDELPEQRESLGESEPLVGDAAKWYALLDIRQVPTHVSDLIFDEENESQVAKLVNELPTVIPILWYLLLTAGSGFVLWWRYREMRA